MDPSSISAFLRPYQETTAKSDKWLIDQLQTDGSYSGAPKDIACYYKHAYVLNLHGKTEEANRLLDFVKSAFLTSEGEFTSSPTNKSDNPDLVHYRAYTNTWIVMAAHQMNRFDVSYPGWKHIATYFNPSNGGFNTNFPYGKGGDDSIDILTTSHLGFASILLNDLEKALAAGKCLRSLIDQHDENILKEGLCIRMDKSGKIIQKSNPENLKDLAPRTCFRVRTGEPGQLFFMIGYPLSFLGYLYRATGDKVHLETAQLYLNFLHKCHPSYMADHWSHKVAWGTSLIANITNNIETAKIAKSIVDHLVKTQNKDGSWVKELGPLQEYDQSAEVGIWVQTASTLIAKFKF